jgi:ankyrin repeat protein
MTALIFGFAGAAAALVRRGARADRLAVAAGLGMLAEAQALVSAAGPEERHRALALAAQLGRLKIVEMLLDAGEDPDRFNLAGMHAHATPLHHAALAGHEDVVRLFVSRGARLDIADTIWNSTPCGWAEYAGHRSLAAYLRQKVR